jgi:hypothetical protein
VPVLLVGALAYLVVAGGVLLGVHRAATRRVMAAAGDLFRPRRGASPAGTPA